MGDRNGTECSRHPLHSITIPSELVSLLDHALLPQCYTYVYSHPAWLHKTSSWITNRLACLVSVESIWHGQSSTALFPSWYQSCFGNDGRICKLKSCLPKPLQSALTGSGQIEGKRHDNYAFRNNTPSFRRKMPGGNHRHRSTRG
jgi:hypothetical protein